MKKLMSLVVLGSALVGSSAFADDAYNMGVALAQAGQPASTCKSDAVISQLANRMVVRGSGDDFHRARFAVSLALESYRRMLAPSCLQGYADTVRQMASEE